MGGEQGQLHLTMRGIDRPLDPQMIDEMRPQEAQKNHEQKQRLPARGLENLSGDQPQSKHRQILIMIVSSGKPHPLSAGCALAFRISVFLRAAAAPGGIASEPPTPTLRRKFPAPHSPAPTPL